MKQFRKLSFGKRILAVALCVLMAATITPIGTFINVTAASGDLVLVELDGFASYLDGLTVQLTGTASEGIVTADITSGTASVSLLEDSSYDAAVLKDGFTVATYSFPVEATALATNSFADPIPMDDLLLVVADPIIITQPSNQDDIIFGATSAVFTVEAFGLGTLSYQWYEGTAIPDNEVGTDSATLTITNPSRADDGKSYLCAVSSDLAGTTESSSATLSVAKKPITVLVTALPTTNTATYGDNISLTAEIVGIVPSAPATGMVTFKEGGTPIDGASALALTDNKATHSYAMSVVHGAITADYTGDDNYILNSGSLGTYDINKKNQTPLTPPTSTTVSYPNTIDVAVLGGGTTFLPDTSVVYEIINQGSGAATLSGSTLTATLVGTFRIKATKPGDAAGNYNDVTAEYDITVTPKHVSVENNGVSNKSYDGNTNATFSGIPSFAAGSIEAEDVGKVALVNGTPTFYNKNVNLGIQTSITNFTLSGDNRQNYVIDQPVAGTADITQRTLTVTPDSNQGKLYNSTPEPTLTYSSDPVSGETAHFTGALTRQPGEGTPAGGETYKILAGNLAIVDNGSFLISNYILYVDETIDFTIRTFNPSDEAASNQVDTGNTTNTTGGSKGWANANPITLTAPAGYKISLTNNGVDWDTNVTAPAALLNTTAFSVSYYLKADSNQAVAQKSYVYSFDNAKPQNLTISYSVSLTEKIKQLVTLGYYNPSVTVTISATDETSGVNHFNWTYSQTLGSSTVNLPTETAQIDSGNIIYTDSGKTAAATFTLTGDAAKQYNGYITFTATDNAANTSSTLDDSANNVVVVDTINPQAKISYSGTLTDKVKTDSSKDTVGTADSTTRYIYSGDITATVEITDANFYPNDNHDGANYDPDDVLITVSKTLDSVTTDYPLSYLKSDWVKSGDKYMLTFTLSGDGDYVVTVSQKDRSQNNMDYTGEYDGKTGTATYTSNILTIDTVAPALSVVYNPADSSPNAETYKTDRTATIQITEKNFRPKEITPTFTAKNVQGNDIATALTDINAKGNALKEWTAWTEITPDVWEATITFSVDANYTFVLNYKDLAQNPLVTYIATPFSVDHAAPDNLAISYSTSLLDKIIDAVTFGYYNPNVTVKITADDEVSGVDYFNLTYTQEDDSPVNKASESAQINTGNIAYSNNGKTATAEFVLDGNEAQYRGSINFSATDHAGNKSNDLNDAANEVVVVDTINPQAKISYSGTLTDKIKTDSSKDTVSTADSATRYIYSGDITATIEITDANFYPNDNRDGADYDSDDVLITVSKTLDSVTADYPLSYVKTDWVKSGDKYTLTFTLSGDGDYVVTVTQKDRSQNDMDYTGEYDGKTGSATYTSNKLTIDMVDPILSVVYNPADSSPNAETYKTDRTATLTVTDRNFRPYELFLVFTAKDLQSNDVATALSDINAKGTALKEWSAWTQKSENAWEATITFSVDAKYTFVLDYDDLSENPLPTYTATAFTIDHRAPENLTITYSTSLLDKVISAVTFGYYNPNVTVTITADDFTSEVDYFNWTYAQEPGTSTAKNVATESAQINTGNIIYSNSRKTATATFTLTAEEAKQYRGSILFTATDKAGNESNPIDEFGTSNYDGKNVVVVDTISPTRTITYPAPKQIVDKSSLNTSGVDVNTENTTSIFFYDGAVTATIKVSEANFYEEDVVVKVNGIDTAVTWTKDADEYTATVTLTGDGDYIIAVAHTDRSTNKMVDYQSEQITIDTINPTAVVSYAPAKEIRTLDGRTYYDAVQTATITITEHNFRADDVVAAIVAKDITGADVSATLLNNLKSHLSTRNNWTKSGDVYTATITYADDANYTFDIDYKDLALRQISDYTPDLFTVDTIAPTNYRVEFSTNLRETLIENVSFGYYNAKVKVTISADDTTAGIYRFIYDYTKNENVSAVNAELLKQAIDNAQVTYSNNGKTATTSFEIPKDVLTSNNQFNGTVAFTSFDRSENSTDEIDNRRLVVDSIAPTATITYNDPVQNANGIFYYAGDINATINITEANFFSHDVNVSVTRGGAATPVNVNWVDNSLDAHTGTFTLTSDGDYIISVTYNDRSNNGMTDYKSNQLTIDTQKPTIRIDGIKNDSANNEDTIGFTITANDTNFDTSKFHPVLTAVVKDENSEFRTVTLSNGTLKTLVAGKEYAYTFENLDADGIYSLVCTMTDLSGNSFSDIVVTDSGNTPMQTVTFSVNRKGSTFALDDNTTKLVETYYVQNVYNNVVVIETNADPLESYKITLNGKELTEYTDYTVSHTGGNGNWEKYTYSVNKSLFEAEGEYKVVVSSKDKAENDAYSDIKSAEVNYVVDRTAPVLTISGLQDNGRYQVKTQTVTIIPKDDGGKLKSLKVIVNDSSGIEVAVPYEKSGEEFLIDLETNGGKFTFDIPSGYNQSVQIRCNDLAQNENGDTNLYDNTFKNVTVSTNIFVIYFANKPLFFGSIGGIVLIAAALWFFLVFKRRKKDEDEKAKSK
jgi:hypothetical protein